MATSKTTDRTVTDSAAATKKAATPKSIAKKASEKPVKAKADSPKASKVSPLNAEKVKTESAKSKASPRKKAVKAVILTSEERYRMIAEAAYYIAEKNGFAGHNVDYWLQAEQEIDAGLTR